MCVWISGEMQLKKKSEKIGNMAALSKRKIEEKNGEETTRNAKCPLTEK